MPSYPELKLYIGGEWRRRDGAPVINSVDQSILGTVPHAAGRPRRRAGRGHQGLPGLAQHLADQTRRNHPACGTALPAHRVINGIDTEAASQMPGVLGVYTGPDLTSVGVKNMPLGMAIPTADGTPPHRPSYP